MKKTLFIIFLSSWMLSAQNNESMKGSLTGFDGLKWGTGYTEAKERFRTIATSPEANEPANIISDTAQSEIKLKRKNVIYRYVFYQTPEVLRKSGKNQSTSDTIPDTTAPKDGKSESANTSETKSPGNGSDKEIMGRLFFIESAFPYVPAQELTKKITEKYGARNGGIVNEKTNRGYYLWSLNSGFIVQWIEPYKQKAFSHSIYYISKEIAEEIRADYPKFQYSTELKTIMNILY